MKFKKGDIVTRYEFGVLVTYSILAVSYDYLHCYHLCRISPKITRYQQKYDISVVDDSFVLSLKHILSKL